LWEVRHHAYWAVSERERERERERGRKRERERECARKKLSEARHHAYWAVIVCPRIIRRKHVYYMHLC
jgi:hypothetical protein